MNIATKALMAEAEQGERSPANERRPLPGLCHAAPIGQALRCAGGQQGSEAERALRLWLGQEV